MPTQPAIGQAILGQSRLGDNQAVTQFQHQSTMGITYTMGQTPGTTMVSGLGVLGLTRLGDGLAISLSPRKSTLGVSYSITPSKYGVPLGASYTIQRHNTAPLLAYYLITAPSSFAINGDGSIVAPDKLLFTLRPVTGRSLIGSPFIQGYTLITWSYSVLLWSELQALLKYYNPNSPIVRLTYPDENGLWVQRNVTMHPPTYGEMENFHINGAVLTFSVLPS